MHFSGVYKVREHAESYVLLLLKMQAGFLAKIQATSALTNRFIWKMVTGLLQIHFYCFTLLLAEKASSVFCILGETGSSLSTV